MTLGTSGITANPGGGQPNAVQLASNVNRVTTVATAGDSVLLPVATPGMAIMVINAAANSLNVFPSSGDAINVLGANNAFAIAATKVVAFVCANTGQWHTILTA
jgi:hypothetical protein